MLHAGSVRPALPRALPGFLVLCLLAGGSASFPARAAVVHWLGLEEMTARAEVIVLGKVEEAAGAWSEDGRIIVTRVTASVERAIKGGPRARVTFEVPGGSVGDQIMVASGAPVFRVGERVIVFLEPAGAGAAASGSAAGNAAGNAPGSAPGAVAGPESGRLAVVGWNLGKLDVRRDRQTGRDLVHPRAGGVSYLDREGRPVGGQAATGPVELGQFLREIEGLAARGRKAGAE
jgi:hypothetical protein